MITNQVTNKAVQITSSISKGDCLEKMATKQMQTNPT